MLGFLTTAPKRKADPLTLESLVAWLERQDPETAYMYRSSRFCLLARYFGAQGYRGVSMGTGAFSYFSGPFLRVRPLPRHFDDIAVANVTFGGALADARAALLADALHGQAH